MMNEKLKTVSFVVYGNPVPKQRARTVTTVRRGGQKHTHSFTPVDTVIQEQKIALVYKSAYHDFKFPKNAPLAFKADVFLKIPKQTSRKKREAMNASEIRPIGHVGDVDNFAKCVADALLNLAYEDDCQIAEMTCRKFYSDQPRTEIYITMLNEGDDDD